MLCTHVVCECARAYTPITVSQHAFLHLKLGLSSAVQDLPSFSCSPLGDPKWVQLQIHLPIDSPYYFPHFSILSPATINSCSYNRKSSLRCESTTGQPFSYAPTKYTRAPCFEMAVGGNHTQNMLTIVFIEQLSLCKTFSANIYSFSQARSPPANQTKYARSYALFRLDLKPSPRQTRSGEKCVEPYLPWPFIAIPGKNKQIQRSHFPQGYVCCQKNESS